MVDFLLIGDRFYSSVVLFCCLRDNLLPHELHTFARWWCRGAVCPSAIRELKYFSFVFFSYFSNAMRWSGATELLQ